MPRNKNPELDKEKKIAKNLENLLSNIEEKEDKRDRIKSKSDSEDTPDIRPIGTSMDFETVKKESENEAEEALESIIDFYCNADLISDELIEKKKNGDILGLSNVFFQLKTAQYAITKTLEEISVGNTNPRIFEALASLQNQMMNIVKHQAAYVAQIQESYKQIATDFNSISPKQMQRIKSGEETVKQNLLSPRQDKLKVRGTKNLIDNLDISEVEIIRDDNPKLTDARNRPDAPEYAKEKEKEEKEDPYKIDDDLF